MTKEIQEQLSKYLKYYQEDLSFVHFGRTDPSLVRRAQEVLEEVYKSLYKPLERFNAHSLAECNLIELNALKGFLEDCMIIFSKNMSLLSPSIELVKKNTELYSELVRQGLKTYATISHR